MAIRLTRIMQGFSVGAAALVAVTTSLSPTAIAEVKTEANPEEVNYRVTKSQFEAARSSSRKSMANMEKKRATVERFRYKSAQRSKVDYAKNEVEVVDVSNDVEIALPRDSEIEEILVSKSASGKTSVSVKPSITKKRSSNTATRKAAPKAKAAASWSQVDEESFLIVLKGAGEMLITGSLHKLINDGEADRDYYTYRQKGFGQDYQISGVNWAVTGMLIRNSIIGNWQSVLDWVDLAPGQDMSGNCDSSYATVGIAAKGVNLAYNFFDCDNYDVTFDSAKPGHMQVKFSQGAVFSPGNREVAYQATYSMQQGEEAGHVGWATLEMARWTYPAKTCEGHDGGFDPEGGNRWECDPNS